jgi:hypothetical protein
MALHLNFLPGLLLSFIVVVHAVPVNGNGLDLLNVTLSGGNMTSTSPPPLCPSPLTSPTDFNMSTIQGYDPSFEWHDYSMVQLWMGKDKVTVGDTTGQDLYNIVSSLLDKNCPSSSSWGICNHIPNAEFTGRCLKKWPSLTVDCTTGIWEIKAVWSSETVRKALIHAVAGALGGITAHEVGAKGGNCFMMGARKACNVGDVVRVSIPPLLPPRVKSKLTLPHRSISPLPATHTTP